MSSQYSDSLPLTLTLQHKQGLSSVALALLKAAGTLQSPSLQNFHALLLGSSLEALERPRLPATYCAARLTHHMTQSTLWKHGPQTFATDEHWDREPARVPRGWLTSEVRVSSFESSRVRVLGGVGGEGC